MYLRFVYYDYIHVHGHGTIHVICFIICVIFGFCILFKASMNKYHTLFLSNAGQVYSCGHGLGGRLGQGHQSTVVVRTASFELCAIEKSLTVVVWPGAIRCL